jgi:hypothetical protein
MWIHKKIHIVKWTVDIIINCFDLYKRGGYVKLGVHGMWHKLHFSILVQATPKITPFPSS